MEGYASKDEFYGAYPDLKRGWGDLGHTSAPGGWDTAFWAVRREGDDRLFAQTWSVAVVSPYPEIQGPTDGGPHRGEAPVPGAVSATASETKEVLVLFDGPDLRPAWAALTELETSTRRPNDLTLEEVAAAVSRAS